ncbi:MULTISPECIES: replication-associated recombination protein A [Xanthomonas]|uniref:Replication-associated recombination protein A n=1 Tax=Xanthomonas sacchari TaxID=56458 RepID=A0ABT3DXM5_9XANT|nr:MULTISPECIES: replication-associated recombination protein A [Xanthomonas]MCC4590678.1 replication-associated recombination protein A [Xanthomonas campestris pv. cannae]MCW0372701.1 Replication-associated recombination protein A [Xanthomonas sacchari]MCW0386772.1 Replication-associated recombination protein A [Xanthomonas sacchari]MCW0399745.1 Replication-associated recombination protein A [Xanthomonas sacchari]MCW0405248.1 Replication-associated recombination protein A [Xanthomonas sacchar
MAKRRPFASDTPDLLSVDREAMRPLAERMRPRTLDEMVGQKRLLAPTSALRRAVASGRVHSMILWGPPGCGKTTLALLLAQYAEAEFKAISAVLSGLPEVRGVLAEAAQRFADGRRTVLFVDEVHRFNKAQQDAFLPHIERGTILFVGATTENPSFELNSALLSRCRVHVLEAVSPQDIAEALQRALHDPERGLGAEHLQVSDAALLEIAGAADGDVRRALTLLEIAAELAQDEGGEITAQTLQQVLADRTRRFDKGGEQFYDQISALHKSVRSSNPDAALYWLTRMLDGGCDPSYLARRLTRMAIEDIGLADPRAQSMALEAWDIYERLGSPEGELAFAQLVLYLASTAKSNAGYAAFNQAKAEVRETGTQEVPLHLRNAPTKLMKTLGYGADYQYDHDAEGGIALDQTGFPDAMGERVYYRPVERGLEIKLKDKLDRLRAAREQARAEKAGTRG